MHGPIQSRETVPLRKIQGTFLFPPSFSRNRFLDEFCYRALVLPVMDYTAAEEVTFKNTGRNRGRFVRLRICDDLSNNLSIKNDIEAFPYIILVISTVRGGKVVKYVL